MRIWNRLNTFCFVRCAYFRTWRAHVYIVNTVYKVIFILLNTLKLLINLSLQKNTDFTRFFIIKPRHTGWLKNISGWKKTLSGSPGHMQQNAYYRNLKWTFEDLLPCYCYAFCSFFLAREKLQKSQKSYSLLSYTVFLTIGLEF